MFWNENEIFSVETNKIKNRKLVVNENVIPFKLIINELSQLSSYSLKSIQYCIDSLLFFGKITKEEDRRLNELGLRSAMPPEYHDISHEWYKNLLARYLKADTRLVEY